MPDVIDQIRSPALQRLHADWEARRHGRELPARADFDPLDLRYILGYLNLVEVLRDPLRFRYRLFGTGMAQRIGVEMTGRLVEEYPDPQIADHVHRRYAETMALRRPTVVLHNRVPSNDRTLYYESLVLPLSSDGVDTDMLMAGFVFFPDR